MKPTQTQIDAAALALYHNAGAPTETLAKAALTAAARVGTEEAENRLMGFKSATYGDVVVDQWDKWYGSLPADIRCKLSLHDFKRLGDLFAAAAEVGEQVLVSTNVNPLTGLPDTYTLDQVGFVNKHLADRQVELNATIERCAQVAEQHGQSHDETHHKIAAAIRKLRDE